jgi:hypothetical protein
MGVPQVRGAAQGSRNQEFKQDTTTGGVGAPELDGTLALGDDVCGAATGEPSGELTGTLGREASEASNGTHWRYGSGSTHSCTKINGWCRKERRTRNLTIQWCHCAWVVKVGMVEGAGVFGWVEVGIAVPKSMGSAVRTRNLAIKRRGRHGSNRDGSSHWDSRRGRCTLIGGYSG